MTLPAGYIEALTKAAASSKIPARLGWYEGGKYFERQVWPEDLRAVRHA